MTASAGTDPCDTACPFCQPAPERIVFENPLVIALWDAFPVNRGHALIVPRRHVPSWFDASAELDGAYRGDIPTAVCAW
jgi:diadenosine tetraphosphate (Ap4A) HIT family hydrolase